MGDLCDNIGLVLVGLPSGSADVAPSPSQYNYDPAIRDPYFVSCIFYACWQSLLPLLKFKDFLLILKAEGNDHTLHPHLGDQPSKSLHWLP